MDTNNFELAVNGSEAIQFSISQIKIGDTILLKKLGADRDVEFDVKLLEIGNILKGQMIHVLEPYKFTQQELQFLMELPEDGQVVFSSENIFAVSDPK